MLIPASWLEALIWIAHIAVTLAALFLLVVLTQEWVGKRLW